MAYQKIKDVLTTGEVAKICNVAPRTVSKWFDTGVLIGYRIPGSKDRRIPLNQLIRFMKAHGMPTDALRGDVTRVMVVDDDEDKNTVIKTTLGGVEGYEVETASEIFVAGATAEKFRPDVIVVNADMNGVNPSAFITAIRENPDLQLTRVIVAGQDEQALSKRLGETKPDCFLQIPYNMGELLNKIREVVEIA
jgi:excisionase family DNA binding protein